MKEKSTYKISSLQEKQELIDETLSLIEKSFGYNKTENHCQQDFAILFNPKNYRNLFILTDNDKVIAHIGCLPRELIFNNKNYVTSKPLHSIKVLCNIYV